MTRFRGWLALLACVAVVCIAVPQADARVGGGFSGGSRGSKTFSAPPSTRTTPGATAPIQRTITQPGSTAQPSAAGARPGGLFGGGLFGGGLVGGLAAGFLGAGLFGMLTGAGFFGGMGGFASLLGLILQIVLVVFVARLVMAWWQRRNAPAFAATAGVGPAGASSYERGGLSGLGSAFGLGGGGAGASEPLNIDKADYDAFEALLGEIQDAYSREDLDALRARVTPEMLSYFADDLSANASRGIVNRVSGVQLLQGDLAEAWREGAADYASVAMRFALVDQMIERASGRVVSGSDAPQQVTEVWTFRRSPGGRWILSAIQQA